MRYRDHAGGITHRSLSKMDRALSKLGTITKVRGYRYRNKYGSTNEAVMVYGANGTARFEGVLWGYGGEGPHGLRTLLLKLGVDQTKAETVAFHVRRKDTVGTDWTLRFQMEHRLSIGR